MPGAASHASGASSSNFSESYMRAPPDRPPHGPGPGHSGAGATSARGGVLDKPPNGVPPQDASALSAAYDSPVASAPISTAAHINNGPPRPAGHSISAVGAPGASAQNSPPADLVDLGLNEDSAVLPPIAIQEEEPVGTHALFASNACAAVPCGTHPLFIPAVCGSQPQCAAVMLPCWPQSQRTSSSVIRKRLWR